MPQDGEEEFPEEDPRGEDEGQQGEDGAGKLPGVGGALWSTAFVNPGEGGEERGGECSFAEESAGEVGDAEGERESVHRLIETEDEGGRHVADGTQHPADHGRADDDPQCPQGRERGLSRGAVRSGGVGGGRR